MTVSQSVCRVCHSLRSAGCGCVMGFDPELQCPTCGQAVAVVSSDEGTQHYARVDHDRADRYRKALELIASARGPLIEADPATLGHGFEKIAKDALTDA